MPSGKNFEQFQMSTLCFGDVTRDEINSVLNNAGVSLYPPIKTPFVTGIKQRKRPIRSPLFVDQSPPLFPRVFETVLVERLSEDGDKEPFNLDQKIVESTPIETSTTDETNTAANTTSPTTTAKNTTVNSTNATNTSTNSTTTTTDAIAADTTLTQTTTTDTTTSSSTTTTEPPSPQPKAKSTVSSWASLLKKNESTKKPPATTQTAPSANGTTTNGKMQGPKTSKPTTPTPSATPKFTGVADIISKFQPTYTAPLIQPRGLINNVNTCFMNVILQPLSHCAPFYSLIKTISKQASHSIKSKTPLLDSIIEFINEFPADRLDGMEPYGEPFVPEYVYNALREQKKFDTLRGRQEDSEEFLCFLLDGLHEEMTAVLKEQHDKKEAEAKANGGGDWLEVGAKNKTSNLRSTGFDESPISKIFGGKTRSVLRCPGAKDSINLEPFQSFPLDIQPDNVHSIEDAIGNMTLPETMHDYTSPKGIKVDATKQVYLEVLPPVLILHLKRFVFDNVGGVQKLSKQVDYGAKLTIDPEWMAPASRPAEPITYKLFGCVYHHGTSAGGGHYTCDIKRHDGEWLHIDDTNITSVKEQDVTEDNTRKSEKMHADQTAYILFYVRSF